MLKKLNVTLVLAFVLAMSAFAVRADDPTTPVFPLPSFDDGRINAYDPGAPVIVFETQTEVPIVNDNGVPTTANVVDGVQLLSWSADAGTATEVLNVSAEDIDAAIAKNKSAVDTFTIAKANGYTLNYSQSGYLWISAPPDFEGKVYTFSWPKEF